MKKKLIFVFISVLMLLQSCSTHVCVKDAGTRIEPTCTAKGSIVYKCKDCGKVLDTVYLPALGHNLDKGTRVEPTCSNEGSITYKCTRCGEVVKTETLPKLEHVWDKGIVIPATCAEPSVKKYECTLCHEVKYDKDPIAPALGHKWDDGVVIVDPKITGEGSTKYTCTRCKETKTVTTYFIPDTVEAGVVYVRKNSSGKVNGSKKYPYTDIQAAINSLSHGEVRIEQGTYEINNPLKMKPGVSINGSYTVENHGAKWTAPIESKKLDKGANPTALTIINNKAIAAGTETDYLATIIFDGEAITSDTCIKNVEVGYDALSRAFTTAILVKNGAKPSIESCYIKGGVASSVSNGLRVSNATVQLKNVIVESGAASSSVAIENNGKAITLDNVSIKTAVAGKNTIGLNNKSCPNVQITNSTILSKGLNSDGFYGFSYGINNDSSTISISNCDIQAGGGGPLGMFGISIGTRAINDNNSKTSIKNSDITCLNSAFGGSGASYWNNGSNVIIANSKIKNTNSTSAAYGIYSSIGSLVLVGNVIEGGQCGYTGGDTYSVFIASGDSIILNNTIVNNTPNSDSSASYGLYLSKGNSTFINNIFTSKEHNYPGYGFYSESAVPNLVKNNAFFGLNTALYAPQGKTGVYYVTEPSMFDETRTKLTSDKLSGNIGSKVGNNDQSWKSTTIFKDATNSDYVLKNTANNAIREQGLNIDKNLLETLLKSNNYKISASELINLLSTDRNGNLRSKKWSIGAFQYK